MAITIPLQIIGLGSITRGIFNIIIILFVLFGLWSWPGNLIEKTLKCEEEPEETDEEEESFLIKINNWGCDNQFLISCIIGLILIIMVYMGVGGSDESYD